MVQAWKRFKRRLRERVEDRWFFEKRTQNRFWQKQFLFSAFRALKFNRISGDYAEFGCHRAISFTLAWREARRYGHPAHLWAFDSFQGLPPAGADDDHARWVEGAMTTTLDEFHALCAEQGVPRAEYTVVPGFYEESLARLGAGGAPADIALAYIDCDMHSSTQAVLDFLAPRLKHGMILAFDDWFCWTDTQASGERRAFLDFQARHPEWEFVPYIQYGWRCQSFVVERRAGTAG